MKEVRQTKMPELSPVKPAEVTEQRTGQHLMVAVVPALKHPRLAPGRLHRRQLSLAHTKLRS
jgi:hypothetical protein